MHGYVTSKSFGGGVLLQGKESEDRTSPYCAQGVVRVEHTGTTCHVYMEIDFFFPIYVQQERFPLLIMY